MSGFRRITPRTVADEIVELPTESIVIVRSNFEGYGVAPIDVLHKTGMDGWRTIGSRGTPHRYLASGTYHNSEAVREAVIEWEKAGHTFEAVVP